MRTLIRKSTCAFLSPVDPHGTPVGRLVFGGQVTGDYGTPPLFSVYRIQLLAYMVILSVCKAVTTAIVIAADDMLSTLANALFAPVRDYPELELTIVMIICPW